VIKPQGTSFPKVAALPSVPIKLGVSQAAVSRIQQPHDLLLSTLNAYLQAVGGRARVIVRFADGHEVDLDLSAFTETHGETAPTGH
jgi:hypothetical protein